ncbi:energy transducer TonB [Adhaeribacter soli]|nr:energy transducer TonB [Adhaeribacter soli]
MQSQTHSKTKTQAKPQSSPAMKAQGQDKVYVVADQMPAFPGGETALKEYFKKALITQNFPSAGTVTLNLIIDKNGQPKDLRIVTGLSPEIDAKVLETARKMPQWSPGKKGGQAVNVRLNLPVTVTAQGSGEIAEEEGELTEIYSFVEQSPEFPGGTSRMYEFMVKNLQYPAAAQEKGIEGRSIVQFVVTKTGKIRDVSILKSLGKEIDEEAMRLVKSMPVWTPGKQNGRAVHVRYTMPIMFRLDNAEKK